MFNRLIFKVSQKLRKVGVDFREKEHPVFLEMDRKIREIGGVIQFKIEFHPDGSWTAESANIDGIITGGTDAKEMSSMIKDAIFTYFNIPPHLVNDKLLRADNEPVLIERSVWATN